MKTRLLFCLLIVLSLLLTLGGAVSAQAPNGKFRLADVEITQGSTYQSTFSKESGSIKTAIKGDTASVIVKLDVTALASYKGDRPGMAPTSPSVTGKPLDPQSAAARAYLAYVDQRLADFAANAQASIPQARVTQQYDYVLGGVAMQVPASRLADLARIPGVQAIYPDALQHVDTDNSPKFIGATKLWQQLGGQESAGENVVVGELDTGIWPEHPSFSDPDPEGKFYPPPPPPLTGTRRCQFTGGANPGAPFTCNKKLIGAYRFMTTYEANVALLPGEFTTARDDDGHGTHTSSTAAGNGNVDATIFGIDRGIVSGIAPRAHVIMYKVCGAAGCFNSDSAAAVQQAIKDGVNVINFSISGGGSPYGDAVELAFLDAYNAGVFVAASAGNAGPGADTTDHRGPWVTTVAASTQNRAFETTATLKDGKATLKVTGASLTAGISTPTSIVVAASAPYSDTFCLTDYPAGTFTGKVVVCERGGGGGGRAEKGKFVADGGAAGMILYNQNAATTDLETDNHYLPAVQIQNADGVKLLAFLASHPNAMVTWPQGQKVGSQGDVMASFSSRGGPAQTLGVSKPDITAPGVEILAGNSPQHVGVAGGPEGELFQAIAGTSMSSPHIAGSAALIKALHPDWTPGQIKSAIMTTAFQSVVKEDGTTPANAFDDGSGRVDLSKAGNPGGTFDVAGADYVTYKDQLYLLNYPSLFLPSMPGEVSVKRTLQDTSGKTMIWQTSVSGPADLKITVPNTFTILPKGSKTFAIKVNAANVPLGATRFGIITFTGRPANNPRAAATTLHFPVTIVRGQATVSLTKSCDPATFKLGNSTTCTITATNTRTVPGTIHVTDTLPPQLKLQPNGGAFKFDGPIAAATHPVVTVAAVATGTVPSTYLPLSAFAVPPVSGVGDDSVSNFTTPAFVYAGNTYTGIGIGSNGYAVVGGASGNADVAYLSQQFPNPIRPNNVLAPYWTDFNPSSTGAGSLYVGILTDNVSGDSWLVLDWEGVQEFGSPRLDTFEIWLGLASNSGGGPEDISFVYGPLGGMGTGNDLGVGAENAFGDSGQSYYYSNGSTITVGTLPDSTIALRVHGTAGAPGTKVLTFGATGVKVGAWDNFAMMTSDLFFGTSIAKFSGKVTR